SICALQIFSGGALLWSPPVQGGVPPCSDLLPDGPRSSSRSRSAPVRTTLPRETTAAVVGPVRARRHPAAPAPEGLPLPVERDPRRGAEGAPAARLAALAAARRVPVPRRAALALPRAAAGTRGAAGAGRPVRAGRPEQR